MESMIIKLKIPLASSLPREDWVARAHDEHCDFDRFFGVDARLLDLMAGRANVFWECHLENDIIMLEREVPDPGW
jgi:hypothetical protein